MRYAVVAIIIDNKIVNVKLFYERYNSLYMLTKHLDNKDIIKPVCAIIGQQVKLFADSVSSSALQVKVFRITGGSGMGSPMDVEMSFSGYLIDAP